MHVVALVTLLAERHEDNPSYTAFGAPFPRLEALRLYCRARPPGAALYDTPQSNSPLAYMCPIMSV